MEYFFRWKCQKQQLFVAELSLDDNYIYILYRAAMASMREQIQLQRKELSDKIFKSYKTYQGAENLLKATESREVKEKTVLQLNYIQSQWSVLREKLHELNSKIESYQNMDGRMTMTMLAVGLKESLELDNQSKQRMRDIILEHYSENPENYEKQIEELVEVRRKSLKPIRSNLGINTIKSYFNQLYFLETRFFEGERSNAVHFSWFDCLSGTLFTQFSIDFEKACVMFNLGALHSQIATKSDRSCPEGVEEALKHYQLAAGTFRFLKKYFVHTPCPDLSDQCLEILRALMLAQAQECLFERVAMDREGKMVISNLIDYLLAVVDCYQNVSTLMNTNLDVPHSWNALISAKLYHYIALSHYYAANLCFEPKILPFTLYEIYIGNVETSNQYSRAYGDICIENHSEALRKVKGNKYLKHIDSLVEIFTHTEKRSTTFVEAFPKSELDEIDFLDVKPLDSSKNSKLVEEIEPEFESVDVSDIFIALGPLAVFNAKNNWSAPKEIAISRPSSEVSFGFTVRGNIPVVVASVDHDSFANKARLKEGDVLVKVNAEDVKWAYHKEVVSLIKSAGNHLILHVVSMVLEDAQVHDAVRAVPQFRNTQR